MSIQYFFSAEFAQAVQSPIGTLIAGVVFLLGVVTVLYAKLWRTTPLR